MTVAIVSKSRQRQHENFNSRFFQKDIPIVLFMREHWNPLGEFHILAFTCKTYCLCKYTLYFYAYTVKSPARTSDLYNIHYLC